MDQTFFSVLLLTILLIIGLGFFLKASFKDRTTIVDVFSSKAEIELLDGVRLWLLKRGWKSGNVDIN